MLVPGQHGRFVHYLVLLGAYLSSGVRAAHSVRRVVRSTWGDPGANERYDRSITTFDPTGRLLQVEYGWEASRRGESILAVLLLEDSSSSSSSSSSDDVARMSEATAESSSDSQKSTTTHPCIYVLVRQPASSEVRGSFMTPMVVPKAYRIDHHLFMFTAGFASDARAWASTLRVAAQQHRLTHGEPMTVEQAARYASQVQHRLTRTGGARPLGCTALIVGRDPLDDEEDDDELGHSSSENDDDDDQMGGSDSQGARRAGNRSGRCLRIFRTGPGGTLEDCWYASAGRDELRLMELLAAEPVESPDEQQQQQQQQQEARSAAIGGCDPHEPDLNRFSNLDPPQRPGRYRYHASRIHRLVRVMEQAAEDIGRPTDSGDASSSVMDVWMLEPDATHRGGLRVTCLLDVSAEESLLQLESTLDAMANNEFY